LSRRRDPYHAGQAAASTALQLLRDAQRDGALRLPPREIGWLARLQKTLAALPSSEPEFISHMMGQVDRGKFVPGDYGLE
jgi:hypothetical protein